LGQASIAVADVASNPRVRILRSTERPFKVKYVKEEGEDAGGLYRDFVDSCGSELMSPQLPLFVPTPNQQSNSGTCRDAWQLQTRPLTAPVQRMLTFLGQIMGICIRRGDMLPVCLSQVCWKLLCRQKPELEDLASEDEATASSMSRLMKVEELGIAAEDFEDIFGSLRFVFHNSSQEEVSLCEGGAERVVTMAEAPEFARLVIAMRLHEAEPMIACIQKGLASVVPVGCIETLWTWQDLEQRICGSPAFDLALLRKRTIYSGYVETDPPVRSFWRALESFGQEDLTRYLHFCWGRSRLPPEDANWENEHNITCASDLPLDSMPRAHTCFFQLDWPRYANYEIAHEKLLYAIRNCADVSIE